MDILTLISVAVVFAVAGYSYGYVLAKRSGEQAYLKMMSLNEAITNMSCSSVANRGIVIQLMGNGLPKDHVEFLIDSVLSFRTKWRGPTKIGLIRGDQYEVSNMSGVKQWLSEMDDPPMVAMCDVDDDFEFMLQESGWENHGPNG